MNYMIDFKFLFLYFLSKQALVIKEILIDMDDLLSTDSHFLLGNVLFELFFASKNIISTNLSFKT